MNNVKLCVERFKDLFSLDKKSFGIGQLLLMKQYVVGIWVHGSWLKLICRECNSYECRKSKYCLT